MSAGVGVFGETWNRREAFDWVSWAVEARVDDRVLRVVRDSTEFSLEDRLTDTVTRHPFNQCWSEMFDRANS